MKNRINLIMALLIVGSAKLFGQVYNKQNTYIDALELKSIYENNRTDSDNSSLVKRHQEILLKYGITRNNIDSNIFLKGYAVALNPLPKSLQPQRNNVIQTLLPRETTATLQSTDFQTAAINGLATFMAGRFKQEFLHVALNQLFKQIKSERDSAAIAALFPKTFKQVGQLYDTGYSAYYTADLLRLRQTAQLDIEQMPFNIIEHSAKIFPQLSVNPKIGDMLLLGKYIYEYSDQGTPLNQLITTLANETYSNDSVVYKILNIADLLSQALLNSQASKEEWVNPGNLILQGFKGNPEVRFFYGLLYQQLIQIPEFKNYMEQISAKNEFVAATKLQELVMFVRKLNNTYSYIKSKDFNFKTTEERIIYLKEINQTLHNFVQTLKNISELNTHFALSESILNASGNYLSIVENILYKDYEKAVVLLLVELGEYMKKEGNASRTISFISQLASIENAADMEALLNAYALPIGSSSIKRNSELNISLNGYVGLTGGFETAFGSQKSQTKGNIGLAAPIGISVTIANGLFTPFVSFVDLGSIVNQRLNNDTTTYTKLRFEHFFTPGIGLFFNCPKLPFTAGLHYNFILNMRTIKYSNGTTQISESNLNITRLNISILVDIPLFTLYNREKKKN